MLENTGWLLVMTIGPIVIGAALIYAYLNRRRLTRREKAVQHEAVQELYEDTPAQRARQEPDGARR